MSQKYNDNIHQTGIENSPEGIGCWREHCWGYVSIYENTPEKLPHLPPKSVQGRAQLEHTNHIVKVGVEATCYTSNTDVY